MINKKNRMTTIVVSLLLIAVLFLMPMCKADVYAFKLDENGIYKCEIKPDQTVYITLDAEQENVDVPSELTIVDSITNEKKTYTVTEICSYGLEKASKKVTLPNTITKIGACAFSSKLTEVNIPESVTSISNSAFYYCSALQKVDVDDDNNSFADINGTLVYRKSDMAVLFIAKAATIEIPEGIKSISNGVLVSNLDLTTLKLPSTFTGDLDGEFFNGDSVIETIEVAPGNTRYTCENGMLIDNTTNTLIWGNSSVTEIPEGVEHIADNAFYNRYNGTTLIIPQSVTSIGKRAFSMSPALTTVIFKGTTAPSIDITSFPNESTSPSKISSIIYPEGSENSYIQKLPANLKSLMPISKKNEVTTAIKEETKKQVKNEEEQPKAAELSCAEVIEKTEQQIEEVARKLQSGELKGPQTIYLDKGKALPYSTIKMLEDNPDISLDFRYRYLAKNYHAVVNGKKHKITPDVKVAGPLYIDKYYGVNDVKLK